MYRKLESKVLMRKG